MELFKRTSYISGENFPSSKNKKKPNLKKFLIFFLKKVFLIFQEGTCKAQKTKLSYISLKRFSHISG